jgi:hypothetical protein
MPDRFKKLPFPLGGVVQDLAYQDQQPHTTPAALNVRPRDVSLQRSRGGSRPGQSVYSSGGTSCQIINSTSYTANSAAGVTWTAGGFPKAALIVGTGGTVTVFDAATGSAVGGHSQDTGCATNGCLSVCTINQKVYIASDGNTINSGSGAGFNSGRIRFIDMTTNAGTGALVGNAGGGTAPTGVTIVANYRDRLVAAGNATWYMSASGDPTNWDYTASGPGAAVSGSTSYAGDLGQPITAIVKHSDNSLLFGLIGEIWRLSGDPLQGGRFRQVSGDVGFIDKNCWCFDPEGRLWFLSRGGLYSLEAGAEGYVGVTALRSHSRHVIPANLYGYDNVNYRCSMCYDYEHGGLHIFVKNIAGPGLARDHWWCDWREGGKLTFWQVTLPADPVACHSFRSYAGTSTTATTGSFSYIADNTNGITYFDRAVACETASYVDYGPYQIGAEGHDGKIIKVTIVVGASSGNVTCAVRAGRSAEEAFNATAQASRTFTTTGRQSVWYPRVRGNCCILRFSGGANVAWDLEDVAIETMPSGRTRVSV